MALTAADWARRWNKGKETVDYCRNYALDAERKMGEILRETELAKGGRPTENRFPEGTGFPTLEEIGVSKREHESASVSGHARGVLRASEEWEGDAHVDPSHLNDWRRSRTSSHSRTPSSASFMPIRRGTTAIN